ncbi:PIN domain-containing protein [Candidatus Woesearchaeota archaeon]|nr:PIN domain-containing protein [Candidatus Woesearchaeota archaeon]
MTKRILDTYALIEISDGNKEFISLLNEDYEITFVTIAEFWIVLYRKFNERTADYWLKKLSPKCTNIGLDIHIKARRFHYKNRKKNISITDCIGYIYAKENNLIFVTGDKEFKGLKNVEFIK